MLQDTSKTVKLCQTYQDNLSTRTNEGIEATNMDAQTSILLAVKGLAAISEAALNMALGVINCNEEIVDVALAVDVVKKHVQSA